MSHTHADSWSSAGPLKVQPVGTECQCATTHSPVAVLLEHHHIWPQEFDGPTVAENLIWICATTHNTVHTYLRLFLTAGKVLSLADLRTVLAAKGYPTHVHRYSVELAHMGFLRIQAKAITPENTWVPKR